MRRCLFISAALLCALPAWAQSYSPFDQDITVGQLGAAQAFDVGAQGVDTGFSPNLWAGTNAQQAKALLKAAPTRSHSMVVTDIVASVLLTGGTPPAGGSEDKDYLAARLGTLVKLGRSEAVDQILGRQPQHAGSAQGQQVQADAALMGADTSAACLIADQISERRDAPYWVKLRAFCHVIRGEVAAAELTADLLRRSGHSDDAFFLALDAVTGLANHAFPDVNGRPLLMAMARKAGAVTAKPTALSADQALKVLIEDAPSLSLIDLAMRVSRLTLTIDTPSSDTPSSETSEREQSDAMEGQAPSEGNFFDLDVAIKADSAASWGQLYGVVTNGRDSQAISKAAGELLRRADANGVLSPFAALLKEPIDQIPDYIKAQGHTPTYAKLAVMDSDLNALRTLYDSLDNEDPLRGRIALASDSIGNGFMLGQLGEDMSLRLSGTSADKRRAVRDVHIAQALGATLSASNLNALDTYSGALSGRQASPFALLGLRVSSESGAAAQTALRAATILGQGGPQSLRADSLAQVLIALRAAGLNSLAGRVAAEDFLSGA